MLAEQVGAALLARHWRLAVAESATGGLVGHLLTAVPGCSAYFWGGVIAYANEVKQNVLGVHAETLARWGAVSPQAALEMAQGVCRVVGVEMAVSITGIAGPTGATLTKPVGLYYIGLAAPGERWVWRYQLRGERSSNNEAIAHAVLTHIRDYLNAAHI
ncbi:MAG TPA: CinA family protein [Anaerolineae bacterium]|nr:CinA family protein [Anaerolineae bacterium]